MNCPYCNKEFIIREDVWFNVETYGSRTCHFPCEKCHNVVAIYGQRTVKFSNPRKTDKESDW